MRLRRVDINSEKPIVNELYTLSHGHNLSSGIVYISTLKPQVTARCSSICKKIVPCPYNQVWGCTSTGGYWSLGAMRIKGKPVSVF